jgi:hypothetical protein
VVCGSVLMAQAMVACGSRTGLLVMERGDAAPAVDSGRPPADTSVDTSFDAGMDTSPDTIMMPDVLPPIDVQPADVVIVGCVDAGATQIYLVTGMGELLSFYPPTLVFTDLGPIACPSPSTPNSMGVDRQGTAYVNFEDGTLFQVSTATAACVPTPFAPGQNGFIQFGMGYVGNPADGGDTLFVASDTQMLPTSSLASIDTNSFLMSLVGPFGPNPVTPPELTGTGDGRLFAFYADPNDPTGSSSLISQIDPATAQEIAMNSLPGILPGQAYAFAFYGGDFYVFTSQMGTSFSQVTRFSPSDGSVTPVAQTMPGQEIVGAGVSTCAPMQ